MHKRIGILRGGTRENYHASLKRGGEIISHISEFLGHKWKPHDILVDREGKWHLGGVPIRLSDLMHRVDMVWNVAHTGLAHSLDSFSIPHVSPSPQIETLKRSRDLLRAHLRETGVKLPRAMLLPAYQEDFDARPTERGQSFGRGPEDHYVVKKAKEVFEKFGAPWIIKSSTEDKNMGVHVAKTFPELVEAIADGVNHGSGLIVEEFITGKPVSVHAVPGFRGRDVYVFPVGDTLGAFGLMEKQNLTVLSEGLYRRLDAKHYAKIDFVLDPKGHVYLLEVEATLDLNPGSAFARACEAAGTKMHHIVEHLLERSLNS